MASKPVLMTAFYEQLTSLVKQMSEMYPDDSDFPLFLTTISLMKNANPSMMIKYINDNVGKFEDKIMAKDDSFFLDYSFDEYAGYVDTNIFSKLKQYIAGMSSESKENVWKYVQNITRLAKACH